MRNGSRFATPAMVGGILVGCVLLLPVLTAVAQQQDAAPRPQAVQNPAHVWELQAKGVAQDLALTPELTTKLVDAYKAARQSHSTILEAQMGQSRAQRSDMAAMRKVNDAEKVKLEAALKEFLNPEQTTKALASLGSFNGRWDRMVATLDGMKLEDAAKAKAMTLVAAYAAESNQAMRAAADSGSFESARENTRKLRDKLDTDLAGVLSAEQMTQWKQSTAMRGGRGGAGRGDTPPPPPGSAPAPAPAE